MTFQDFNLGLDPDSITTTKEHQKTEQKTRRSAFTSANASTSSLVSRTSTSDRHDVVSLLACIHNHRPFIFAYVLSDGQIPPQTMYTTQMARATE
jgi:hypothetical protein